MKKNFKGALHQEDSREAMRVCLLRKYPNEEHGFFLAVDRDRNGQIVQKCIVVYCTLKKNSKM